ncbi:hypothetical protein [Xanthocytophaga agilis]|uniref:STAS/SEC14 domain-containing protein n=1 Tax=Xanthocytophaga agilis TaxID=3048010 RepID=A0AAE3UDN6_9BACT|nr:hypothetical protein [Xanthocytophaga agilis]MDJ1500536.1 hypothetical protein [Xanthocytophaga agilis]
MKILEEKFVNIDYDAASETLIQTWLGFISSENFRNAIDKTVDISREKNVRAIISDTSQLSIVRREDTEYAASVMPELIQNGLKRMAFVLSENAFAQMSVKNFSTQTKEKVEENELVKHFASMELAKKWINSVS